MDGPADEDAVEECPGVATAGPVASVVLACHDVAGASVEANRQSVPDRSQVLPQPPWPAMAPPGQTSALGGAA
eukprot:10222044-Lingulodinium_polyedra.AAC.1